MPRPRKIPRTSSPHDGESQNEQEELRGVVQQTVDGVNSDPADQNVTVYNDFEEALEEPYSDNENEESEQDTAGPSTAPVNGHVLVYKPKLGSTSKLRSFKGEGRKGKPLMALGSRELHGKENARIIDKASGFTFSRENGAVKHLIKTLEKNKDKKKITGNQASSLLANLPVGFGITDDGKLVDSNGRVEGRQLIPWHKPRMFEKLLFFMVYELHRRGHDIPWDQIVHRLHPGSSGQSAQQALSKLRSIMIVEGHLVPPNGGRVSVDTDQQIRGHIRDMTSENPHDVREVRWSEEVEHLSVSLPIEDVVKGSGNYRKSINCDNQGADQDIQNGTPNQIGTPTQIGTPNQIGTPRQIGPPSQNGTPDQNNAQDAHSIQSGSAEKQKSKLVFSAQKSRSNQKIFSRQSKNKGLTATSNNDNAAIQSPGVISAGVRKNSGIRRPRRRKQAPLPAYSFDDDVDAPHEDDDDYVPNSRTSAPQIYRGFKGTAVSVSNKKKINHDLNASSKQLGGVSRVTNAPADNYQPLDFSSAFPANNNVSMHVGMANLDGWNSSQNAAGAGGSYGYSPIDEMGHQMGSASRVNTPTIHHAPDASNITAIAQNNFGSTPAGQYVSPYHANQGNINSNSGDQDEPEAPLTPYATQKRNATLRENDIVYGSMFDHDSCHYTDGPNNNFRENFLEGLGYDNMVTAQKIDDPFGARTPSAYDPTMHPYPRNGRLAHNAMTEPVASMMPPPPVYRGSQSFDDLPGSVNGMMPPTPRPAHRILGGFNNMQGDMNGMGTQSMHQGHHDFSNMQGALNGMVSPPMYQGHQGFSNMQGSLNGMASPPFHGMNQNLVNLQEVDFEEQTNHHIRIANNMANDIAMAQAAGLLDNHNQGVDPHFLDEEFNWRNQQFNENGLQRNHEIVANNNSAPQAEYGNDGGDMIIHAGSQFNNLNFDQGENNMEHEPATVMYDNHGNPFTTDAHGNVIPLDGGVF